ncbi:MAG: cytochrome b/b6 domain-containing protein [Proteobacteria bacterium]|nr:cytochrome b/b6 domain-containing protein [Pseudomonadota bacterium]
MPSSADRSLQTVRVWDLPTRVFHWLLALAVIGMVVTGKIGGNALAWHFRIGYLVMGLLLFRLLWGFVGGHWSRFARFVYSPGTVLRYLRGQGRPDEHLDVGHNPLGAFSVFALLFFLALQVSTGLVADDEIATQGPLNRFVSAATASSATHWHKGAGQAILIVLVLLHVGAIVYYRVRQNKNLVQPMLTGDKQLPAQPPTPAARDSVATRGLAAVLAVVCAGVVTWVVRLGG